MNNWNKVILGDICETNKCSYSKKDGWEYVNYLDTGSITENDIDDVQFIDLAEEKLPSRAKRKVKYNSIIYSTVRPNQLHYGIIKEQPDNFLVSTGFSVIDVNPELVDADYLYYWLTQDLNTKALQSIAEQSVSTYPSIKANDIEDLEIDLPPLDVQKRIANILVALDNKKRNNDKINRNLSEQAQSIFKEVASNSEEKKELKDFIHIKHGFAFKGENIITEDNGNVLVTPGNFNIGGGFKEGKCKFFNGEIPEGYILDPNSLIVTMTDLSKEADTLGYGALVPTNNKRIYLHNQRIGLVQFVSDKLPKDYVYWFLRSYEYQKNIVNSASGSTVKHTSPDRICMQYIPIPNDDDLKMYVPIFESIDEQISKNNIENQNLEELRDKLLPKLMSGELDVSDIDI